MTVWDHALFALLAVLFPLWAFAFGYRTLERAAAADLPRRRVGLYRRAIVIQWTLVAITFALWIVRGRSWMELGLVPRMGAGLIGVLVGLAIIVAFVWRQRRAAMQDDESLASVRRQLHGVRRLMPVDEGELRWFVRLSVTAGICEEILYRGYVFWYLDHAFTPLQTAAIAAVLFGVAHSYQGVRGVLLTTVVGGFLGLVYGVSGSLFAPMAIHALMDVHSGQLGFVAFRRLREQEAEAALAEAARRASEAAAEAARREREAATPDPADPAGTVHHEDPHDGAV